MLYYNKLNDEISKRFFDDWKKNFFYFYTE